MTDQEVIHAFHIMWDNFPEPVIITQRSREIIAVNKKAAELGLTAGIKCSSIGRPEDHKGCLCNRAIDENKSVLLQSGMIVLVEIGGKNAGQELFYQTATTPCGGGKQGADRIGGPI